MLDPGVAFAQVKRPSDRELPATPPIAPPTLPELVLPEAPRTAPGRPSTGDRVLIRTVRVVGNSALSLQDLAPAIRHFEGRVLSTEGFEELRLALTRVYIERGYVNSGALLPDQEILDGVVTYRIVEGRLSSIKIEGNARTRDFYIRDRIWREVGTPLNVRDLRRAIQLLLQDAAIKTVNATLEPGIRPGEARLHVIVEENLPFALGFSVDNSNSRSVGSTLGKISASLLNVAGFGERLTFNLEKSSGSRSTHVEAGIPVTKWDMRASFSYEATRSTIIEEPFDLIDLQTDFDAWNAGLAHPVYRSANWTFELEAEFERKRALTTIFDRRFSLEDGAENGRSVVAVGRFIQNLLYRDRQQVFAFRSTFSKGLNALDANWSDDADTPSGNFVAWLGQAQYVRRLQAVPFELVLRAEIQTTQDRLLGLEKFAIGGLDSLRGYRTNQLVRDRGYTGSVEVRIPLGNLRVPQISESERDGVVQFAPYFDYGRAWDNRVRNLDPKSLYGFGLGLRWQLNRMTGASFYWNVLRKDVAKPLDEDATDRGIYFRISSKLY